MRNHERFVLLYDVINRGFTPLVRLAALDLMCQNSSIELFAHDDDVVRGLVS